MYLGFRAEPFKHHHYLPYIRKTEVTATLEMQLCWKQDKIGKAMRDLYIKNSIVRRKLKGDMFKVYLHKG